MTGFDITLVGGELVTGFDITLVEELRVYDF